MNSHAAIKSIIRCSGDGCEAALANGSQAQSYPNSPPSKYFWVNNEVAIRDTSVTLELKPCEDVAAAIIRTRGASSNPVVDALISKACAEASLGISVVPRLAHQSFPTACICSVTAIGQDMTQPIQLKDVVIREWVLLENRGTANKYSTQISVRTLRNISALVNESDSSLELQKENTSSSYNGRRCIFSLRFVGCCDQTGSHLIESLGLSYVFSAQGKELLAQAATLLGVSYYPHLSPPPLPLSARNVNTIADTSNRAPSTVPSANESLVGTTRDITINGTAVKAVASPRPYIFGQPLFTPVHTLDKSASPFSLRSLSPPQRNIADCFTGIESTIPAVPTVTVDSEGNYTISSHRSTCSLPRVIDLPIATEDTSPVPEQPRLPLAAIGHFVASRFGSTMRASIPSEGPTVATHFNAPSEVGYYLSPETQGRVDDSIVQSSHEPTPIAPLRSPLPTASPLAASYRGAVPHRTTSTSSASTSPMRAHSSVSAGTQTEMTPLIAIPRTINAHRGQRTQIHPEFDLSRFISVAPNQAKLLANHPLNKRAVVAKQCEAPVYAGVPSYDASNDLLGAAEDMLGRDNVFISATFVTSDNREAQPVAEEVGRAVGDVTVSTTNALSVDSNPTPSALLMDLPTVDEGYSPNAGTFFSGVYQPRRIHVGGPDQDATSKTELSIWCYKHHARSSGTARRILDLKLCQPVPSSIEGVMAPRVLMCMRHSDGRLWKDGSEVNAFVELTEGTYVLAGEQAMKDQSMHLAHVRDPKRCLVIRQHTHGGAGVVIAAVELTSSEDWRQTMSFLQPFVLTA